MSPFFLEQSITFSDAKNAKVYSALEGSLVEFVRAFKVLRDLRDQAVSEGWVSQLADWEDMTKADALTIGAFIGDFLDFVNGNSVTPFDYLEVWQRLAKRIDI